MGDQIKSVTIAIVNLAICGIILAAITAVYMGSASSAKMHEHDTD